jgi:hypothetical protein
MISTERVEIIKSHALRAVCYILIQKFDTKTKYTLGLLGRVSSKLKINYTDEVFFEWPPLTASQKDKKSP